MNVQGAIHFILNKLNDKIKFLRIDRSYKATAANTWQNNGTTFTVPDGHAYIVRGQLGYTSARPVGVGFNASSTLGGIGVPQHCYENSSGLVNSPCFMLFSGTYYMFEKRVAVPSNAENNYVYIVDLNYGS